jgi:hypothetical protein
MRRAKLFSWVVMLAIGTTASASDNTQRPVPSQDRGRWLREHREQEHLESKRERSEREAMHKWDREHHRKPVVVKHDATRPEDLKRVRTKEVKAPRKIDRKRKSHVKHARRVAVPPANQQVMNREPKQMQRAPVAR